VLEDVVDGGGGGMAGRGGGGGARGAAKAGRLPSKSAVSCDTGGAGVFAAGVGAEVAHARAGGPAQAMDSM